MASNGGNSVKLLNDITTRRRFFAAVGVSVTSAFAGCTNLGSSDSTTTESYDYLEQYPVYFDQEIGISIPGDVTITEDESEAELIVLPDDTARDAEEFVDWLLADQIVALVGLNAQQQWYDWRDTDVYAEAIDPEGITEAEGPDPAIFMLWTDDSIVREYTRTWGEGELPADNEILSALSEKLGDIRG